VKLSEELRVRQSEDGSFVNVAWRAHDPGLAVATVNGVVDHVVAVAADLRRQRLSELSRILAEQLDHAEQNLRASEAALTAFRVRHATRPPTALAPVAGPGAGPPPDPMLATYLDSRVTAGQMARDRQAILDVLAQGSDSGVSVDALSMITAVQRSAELNDALKELTTKQADLRALRFRYADTHPPVQRLSAQVDTLQRSVIPRLARSLASGLAAQERQLTQRADSLTGELRGAPPVALEETQLERDEANATQLFSTVQQRYDEARLAEASSLPDMRVLERAARLDKPVANLGPLVILLALFGSLGMGTLGAVGLDRMDPKVRNPEAVSRAMGVPVLGAVPRIRGHGTPGEPGADMNKAIEALRGLRLSVQHAYGAAGPMLITVSSPGRGEGKSFVTSNLAQAFADVGFRTLLIDGDVRLGALHRSLRTQRRPGLTDVLAGNIPVENAIQATAHPLLFFMGCGSRMHRGPELLSTPAVPRLLTGLRGAYDVILVDSAPLGAGVDPYALGTATGSMLLVLRTGVSDRVMAEAKVEVLQRMPVRLLGVILNDVRPGPVYSYYAYALSGYEIEQEDPDGATSEILLPERT
jgi:tyrosine-protein kinase Etk/Wzc